MAQKRIKKKATPKRVVKEVRVRAGPDPKWEKLAILRENTRRTGILHEVQVLNLKMWPLIFTNATDSTCEFGYETKQVVFNLTKLKGRMPANLQARLQHLVNATQQLLGGEYEVIVKVDGKKQYHGLPTSD